MPYVKSSGTIPLSASFLEGHNIDDLEINISPSCLEEYDDLLKIDVDMQVYNSINKEVILAVLISRTAYEDFAVFQKKGTYSHIDIECLECEGDTLLYPGRLCDVSSLTDSLNARKFIEDASYIPSSGNYAGRIIPVSVLAEAIPTLGIGISSEGFRIEDNALNKVVLETESHRGKRLQLAAKYAETLLALVSPKTQKAAATKRINASIKHHEDCIAAMKKCGIPAHDPTLTLLVNNLSQLKSKV